MQRRATSKKRAAEAEKAVEMDMENKEAMPVDVESTLPPVLSKQPTQPEEQPELPTQTGEVNLQEKEVEKAKVTKESKMDRLMEMFMKMDENSKEDSCLLYTSYIKKCSVFEK